METNIAGLTRGWKDILRDFRRNVHVYLTCASASTNVYSLSTSFIRETLGA